MKLIFKSLVFAGSAFLAGCGPSAEEKNKNLESAAHLRAKQVCEGDGSLENYGQKLDYLNEQLNEEGYNSQEDHDAAIQMFEKKIRESCPDKYPK